ncbi:MAG: response regulator [Acidobacteria bacterium]|nr:response regulator [Acidobacteriota bacterium]
MSEQRILVIDDDHELCELVTEYVSAEGFDIDTVHDGETGLSQALAGDYALVLLDVMLPGANGFEVLSRLRKTSNLPVIMLTARGDDVDRIVGLEMGADDYLPKPFNPRELVARVRAILRRADAPADGRALIEVGDVRLDSGARTVSVNDDELRVTAVEFEVLERLLRAAGSIVSREQLTRDVLDREYSALDRAIDMHVSNLRKKLGAEYEGAERIKTVRGVGYVYTLPRSESPEESA